MVATLSLDTITSSGSTITVPTGKTLAITDTSALTVGGTAISTGSSNILRKTADYTVVTGDVSGKSELVIATNAAAANRTITLPAVAAVGMSTCSITIICDTDATSTFKLLVQDSGTTEVWTGYQRGDFVRLIVSNSLWVVVDHKETMFSARYLTGDFSVAASATTKITGFTNVTDIGGLWDNSNNKLVSPFAGIWDLNWRLSVGTDNGNSPVLYIGGVKKYWPQTGADGAGYNYGQNMASMRVEVAASTDIEFYSHNISSGGAYSVYGNGTNEAGFDGKFTRTY